MLPVAFVGYPIKLPHTIAGSLLFLVYSFITTRLDAIASRIPTNMRVQEAPKASRFNIMPLLYKKTHETANKRPITTRTNLAKFLSVKRLDFPFGLEWLVRVFEIF